MALFKWRWSWRLERTEEYDRGVARVFEDGRSEVQGGLGVRVSRRSGSWRADVDGQLAGILDRVHARNVEICTTSRELRKRGLFSIVQDCEQE